MRPSRYDRLDDVLGRIRSARQRQAISRRSTDPSASATSLSLLRVLRAVELAESTGESASVRDVADYIAVEHSTASRSVACAVAAGLMTKHVAAEDQRRCILGLSDAGRQALAEATMARRAEVATTVGNWPDADIDTLLSLLERLADDFERDIAR